MDAVRGAPLRPLHRAWVCGRWVVVLGHRQMYADNAPYGDPMAPANGLFDLEPLLARYKVDLAFWGHIHFAQRSCPMLNATCVTTKDASGYDAPIHTIIGNAGQSLSSFPPPSKRARWSVYEGKEWGFSKMLIHNATHLSTVKAAVLAVPPLATPL